MKSVTIQANLFEDSDVYKLSASTNQKIVQAIFVEITMDDIEDILDIIEAEV